MRVRLEWSGSGSWKSYPRYQRTLSPIGGMPHEQAFWTDVLKEHHQLQFEKDHGINGGTPLARIGLLHELPYKGEVECSLQMSIEVIRRNQVFKGHMDERGKTARFGSHHGANLPSSPSWMPGSFSRPFSSLFTRQPCSLNSTGCFPAKRTTHPRYQRRLIPSPLKLP